MSLFATVYVGRVTDAHFDGVVRNVGGVRRAITVVGERSVSIRRQAGHLQVHFWQRQESPEDSTRLVVELMTSHQCIDMEV
jgi:hypothetical protein